MATTMPALAATGRDPSTALVPDLKSLVSRPAKLGFVAGAILFGCFGGWAALAPMAGAAGAMGFVSPEGIRYTIQHLEGGIISKIFVVEGQKVHVGDELVALDNLADLADLASARAKFDAQRAQEIRLRAESAGSDTLIFPPAGTSPTKTLADAQSQEMAVFQARLANLAAQKAVLRQKIEQAIAEIQGAREQIEMNVDKTNLLKREEATTQQLYEKGLERLPRLLSIQRALVDANAQNAGLRTTIAKSTEAIAEGEAQIAQLDAKRRDEANGLLAEARARREAAEEDIKKTQDRLLRSVIRSPVDGTVLTVKFRTERGVVRPGEPIMEIVPAGDDLIIDGRVSVRDMTEIKPGMRAWINFPTYTRGMGTRVYGEVINISADALQDDKSDQRYFRVRLRVDRKELADNMPDLKLQPGLPAEAFIRTHERTMLQYLIQPLRNRLDRAFRER